MVHVYIRVEPETELSFFWQRYATGAPVCLQSMLGKWSAAIITVKWKPNEITTKRWFERDGSRRSFEKMGFAVPKNVSHRNLSQISAPLLCFDAMNSQMSEHAFDVCAAYIPVCPFKSLLRVHCSQWITVFLKRSWLVYQWRRWVRAHDARCSIMESRLRLIPYLDYWMRTMLFHTHVRENATKFSTEGKKLQKYQYYHMLGYNSILSTQVDCSDAVHENIDYK